LQLILLLAVAVHGSQGAVSFVDSRSVTVETGSDLLAALRDTHVELIYLTRSLRLNASGEHTKSAQLRVERARLPDQHSVRWLRVLACSRLMPQSGMHPKEV
jgi:hypothetical protein